MEKKINDFARTKQRKKRIERARETSADFQSKFSTEARQKEREERMNDLLSPSWKGVPVESESHSSLIRRRLVEVPELYPVLFNAAAIIKMNNPVDRLRLLIRVMEPLYLKRQNR